MNESIIIGILSSSALATVIASVIQFFTNRRGRLKRIEEKLNTIEANQKAAEKDALRTQLIMMIADYPNEKTDILRLGEHYFVKLRGNWVASDIFVRWCEKYNDGIIPAWYEGDK